MKLRYYFYTFLRVPYFCDSWRVKISDRITYVSTGHPRSASTHPVYLYIDTEYGDWILGSHDPEFWHMYDKLDLSKALKEKEKEVKDAGIESQRLRDLNRIQENRVYINALLGKEKGETK